MEKRRTRARRGVSWLGVVAVAGAVAVAPGSAQQQRDDCRCVDPEGREIERCTCLRVPRVDELFGWWGDDRERARLGVTVDMQGSAGADGEGARVVAVAEGGPADDAGLREGDVIVAIDGRSLTASLGADAERGFDLDRSIPAQRLLALTRDLEPDHEVEVEYSREGRRQTTRITPKALTAWTDESLAFRLRELADHPRLRLGRDGGIPPFMPPHGAVRGFAPGAWGLPAGAHGLEIVELNPELGAYFGVDQGVLVTDVVRASSYGLRPGDVVLRIGDRPVTTADRFRRIVASYAPEEDVEFRVLRDGEEITVTGRLRY